MEVKCPCKRKENLSLELALRSPLDVLAEKFKDLPISADELIEQIKQLACKVSEITGRQYCSDSDFSKSQDGFLLNDEIKGEIRKFVDDVYKRKSLETDNKVKTLKSGQDADQNFDYMEGWTWDSRKVFYGEQSDVDQGEVQGNRRSLYRSSTTTVEDSKVYDSQWLIEQLGTPLKMALKEIVAKKPYDPVSYLGFWLLHYRKCQETALLQREMDAEILRLRYAITRPTVEERSSEKGESGEREDQGDWNFRNYDNDSIETFAQ